jgi:3-deoxy-D-manno-octulosonic-acid transferase
MWYLLYNLLFTIVLVLALPLLPFLVCLGPRYRTGLAERLGYYSRDLLASLAGSRPVWVHAASVGEVRSAVPLVSALKARAPQRKILLSTFTATGNRQARQIPGVDAVIFFPLDLFWIVRRALMKFDPALLVIIETEIWPNLLCQAYRRGVPTLLLSGRLSAKASARYTLCRSFFARVLGCFSALGMQSVEDAARIVNLGADEKRVSVVGTLKAARLSAESWPRTWSGCLHGKPLLVAGSTHQGEEESLLEALALVRANYPTLSLVIAPRHPERFGDVERLLATSSFVFHRRSQVAPAQWFDKDILLLDSVGELVNFFAAADVAFVGGSLVKVGGHNVLEPARLGKPILFGPHMENFQTLASDMLRQGAAVEVASARELADALNELLADPHKRQHMGQRAAQVAEAHQVAFGLNLGLAERYL